MARDKVVTPPVVVPETSPAAADEPEWHEMSGLTKPQAEQLLDWLEVHGFEQRQVVVGADKLFVVRYRPRGPL